MSKLKIFKNGIQVELIGNLPKDPMADAEVRKKYQKHAPCTIHLCQDDGEFITEFQIEKPNTK